MLIYTSSLLITGCSSDKCKDELEADDGKRKISFTLYKNVPIVTALLNNKKAYFLLDSGASINILDVSSSEKYGFTFIEDNDTTMIGIGGSKGISTVSNYNITCNDRDIKIEFVGGNLKGIRKSINIVGIIGSRYFKKHNAIINFNTKTIEYETKN